MLARTRNGSRVWKDGVHIVKEKQVTAIVAVIYQPYVYSFIIRLHCLMNIQTVLLK